MNVAVQQPAYKVTRWLHAMQWIIADTLLYVRALGKVFGPRLETLFVATKPDAAQSKFMAGLRRPIVVL